MLIWVKCKFNADLIAKLLAYVLVMSSLNLLQDYLLNHKQKTKVDYFFSSSEDILSGVAQGLVSLLFNIYVWYVLHDFKSQDLKSFIFFLFHYKMRNEETYSEQNQEKLKGYAQNHYYPVSDKVKEKKHIKITKKGWKKKHEIVTKISRNPRKAKKR